MKSYNDTESYIADQPPAVQKLLKDMRQAIRKAAPEATEKISYGMPSYHLHGRYLVYFGAFKNHVSLFPASSAATEAFKRDLSGYESSKGTVRFPLDNPLPLPLIRKIVMYRVKENLAKKKK